MRCSLALLCLLSAIAGSESATRAFDASSSQRAGDSAVNPPPSVEISSMLTTPEGPIKVAAVEPNKKETVHTRRPVADQGIRYSSTDWLVNFLTMPFSYTFKRIKSHVIVNVAISLLAIYFHNKLGDQVEIPMTGHSLLGSSLGLLLSYRTNSAYGRFYEARGYWTKTKVTCRNLAILIKYHISEHSPNASEKFLKLISAYPGALMFLCLAGAAKLPAYTQSVLPDNPAEYLEAPNLPSMLLLVELQKTLHEAKQESKSSKYDLVEAAHINAASHMVEDLMQSMASCEKILRTPVPWTYSRHTSRFLTIWLGTLPYALVGKMKPWLVVATVMLVSYCMLGIEEIGHLIEQPFLGDPLDGEEKIYSTLDEDGNPSALIKRGRLTQPYDIGIPVCSFAAQIRKELKILLALPEH